MKAHRPFTIGIALATVWVVGSMTWKIAQTRSASTRYNETPQASSDDRQTEPLDETVWKLGGPKLQNDFHAESRARMVEQQLAARDVSDPRVLDAMRRVPRHEFVPQDIVARAYIDGPLPIGHNQTISQPYIVGLMTQLARPTPTSVALDVGTGSGYQAAVLSLLCRKVYSVEILKPLAESAADRLKRLGFDNVTVRHGDGYRGWVEHGPFDLIIVAAAPEQIPPPLIDQLKPGGRLVIPVGKHRDIQHLLLIEKQPDGGVRRRQVTGVAFVPMTGEAQKSRSRKK
jgi:protein-L-isoaspartate(D-aspartate) O-methyltransferase